VKFIQTFLFVFIYTFIVILNNDRTRQQELLIDRLVHESDFLLVKMGLLNRFFIYVFDDIFLLLNGLLITRRYYNAGLAISLVQVPVVDGVEILPDLTLMNVRKAFPRQIDIKLAVGLASPLVPPHEHLQSLPGVHTLTRAVAVVHNREAPPL